jgi:hypothetical protein
MNNQFDNLMYEAGLTAQGCWDEMDEYDRNAILKFAELIVRECAELSVNSQYVNTKSEYYEGFNEALVYAGNKIKKHFGVEE